MRVPRGLLDVMVRGLVRWAALQGTRQRLDGIGERCPLSLKSAHALGKFGDTAASVWRRAC